MKREIRRLHLTFKWQSIWMSYLEGIFARGDRRLSDAIVKAYHLGCRFDGWSEYLNYGWWEEVMQNVNTDFYTTRRRYEDEVFPWDHIDCGVDRNFLWNEYQKGLKTQFTPDCRIEGCQRCGVCNDKKQHVHNTRDNEMASDCFDKKEDILANNNKCIQLPKKSNTYYKVRVQFAKLGKSRFLSHLELVTLFSRVIRRAGIPIRFSEGFHPLPKIVFGPALPVGVESISEYIFMKTICHIFKLVARYRANYYRACFELFVTGLARGSPSYPKSKYTLITVSMLISSVSKMLI